MGLPLRRSPELLEGGHHELLDVRFLNDIGIQKALEVEAQMLLSHLRNTRHRGKDT
jgi:hypothetical protein